MFTLSEDFPWEMGEGPSVAGECSALLSLDTYAPFAFGLDRHNGKFRQQYIALKEVVVGATLAAVSFHFTVTDVTKIPLSLLAVSDERFLSVLVLAQPALYYCLDLPSSSVCYAMRELATSVFIRSFVCLCLFCLSIPTNPRCALPL